MLCSIEGKHPYKLCSVCCKRLEVTKSIAIVVVNGGSFSFKVENTIYEGYNKRLRLKPFDCSL